MFRCHKSKLTQEWREGERESEKYQHSNILEYKKMKVRMHEHMTCKFKNIMDSAQSKPTSTQQDNI